MRKNDQEGEKQKGTINKQQLLNTSYVKVLHKELLVRTNSRGKQTEHTDKEMTNVSWPTLLDSEKWSLAQQ